MKSFNFSSELKLVKFDIEVNNPQLWKNYNSFFDNSTMKFFSKVIEKTLKQNTLVSILLTDDSNIKILNYRWRKKNQSTNVLSFPVQSFIKEDNYLFIGDIVLSYETIKKECLQRKINFKDHFLHLCLHGILHLIGYDHKNKKEEKEMESMEIKLLSSVNILNPYLTKTEDL
jgi:probable rRNA maturation factor|tara:strand:- start:1100 stop:1615 length:516 start_codon:yes stop_codon:yes gene_type:complete